MEQKWKVRSLISVSETEEIGILSKVLIVISCIFCFLTLMLITFSVSYVDAGNTKKFTYTGGMEEKSETLYELGFVKETKMDPVLTKIYMKSNGVGKNNLYMEPYPVVVQKKQGSTNSYAPIGNRNNKYVNLLGGDELDINSQNISIIGGRDLKVLGGNDNATIFGGEHNKIEGNSTVPRVIIGGKHNTIEGVNGVILGGNGNTIKGKNSFILGGENNTISSSATNAIVAGIKVTANKENIFVFSNDNNGFAPKKDNTFYIKVQKGLGLNMDAGQGVASSGAVSFGSVRGIGNCNATNKGLIGLSGTCLYGCNGEEWQKIGCFDEKWEEDDYFTGYCTGTVYNNGTQGTDQVRYSWCNGGPEKYNNVVFETILWTGNGCPEIRDGENPCVYACAIESGYYYYNDPSGKDSGCKKDCEIPWNRSRVHHGTIITGYSATGVVCEESETAYGCNGKRAVMQCNDGKWVGIGGSKTKQIYNPKGSTDINDIIYKYESCTSSGNICSTGNYQFTKIIENRWFNSGSCTNHIVDVNNMCETTTTIYKGRCYPNHILTGVNGGKCQLGVDTTGCECKPKSQHGVCKYSSLPANAKPVKSWFVQIATGIDSENNWSPSSKSYVLYTGDKEAECTFECNDGFSYWSGQCLSNCTYSGNTYKNGETITGYQSSSVNCPNVCKSKQLTCVDGKWMGGSLTCKTKDKICDGYTFKNTIENAKCDGCTLYSGSLSGTCTTGNTMFNCKCYYNAMSGYYVFNEEGTQCVPATTGANCNKGSKPEGNVDFNYGHTFTQTWSGGAKKWIPESVDYEYNKKGDCGFRCYNGSSYIKSKNKCEGDECINHNFGKTGSYYLYPGSNNGIVGNVGSSLYESASEAQVAYGEGKRCLYYCDKCYSKNGKKCSPKTFKIEYWCKDDGGKRNSTGTQNFTYGVATKVDKRCPDRTGYIFEGWSTGKNSTEASLKYDKKLTTGNYNSCSSTNFYAVYKCAQGYTQNGTECKKNSYTCTGSVPDFAVLVPGSATGGLSEATGYKLYKTEREAVENGKIKPCAYVCDGEHTYVKENGKISCKRCIKSLSTNQTICVDDAKCPEGYVPYYDESLKEMNCGKMSSCYGSLPDHGKIPENYSYQSVGSNPNLGGVSWYCGKKDYGKGCYFECEKGYTCSFGWDGQYGQMWASVYLNWQNGNGQSIIVNGTNCVDTSNRCELIDTDNYKGYYVYGGLEYYGGYQISLQGWTFITGTNASVIQSRLKQAEKNGDCLFACEDGSEYRTGVTLSTYNNGDDWPKFCWKKCEVNEIYSENGRCEKCPSSSYPDHSFEILGNAVRCVRECEIYEKYNDKTGKCEPLCSEDAYYRKKSDNYGNISYECVKCRGILAGQSDEVGGGYTSCDPCPDYTYYGEGKGCQIPECGNYSILTKNGCVLCTYFVDKSSRSTELNNYLSCGQCQEYQSYNYQTEECFYPDCGEDKYLTQGGNCRECKYGEEIDKTSKDSKIGGNYTRCKNICGDNFVYDPSSKYSDGSYCWPRTTNFVCENGEYKETESGYACVYCLADDEEWSDEQKDCVKKS